MLKASLRLPICSIGRRKQNLALPQPIKVLSIDTMTIMILSGFKPGAPKQILWGPITALGALVRKVCFGIFLEFSVDVSWRAGGQAHSRNFILSPHFSYFQCINWIDLCPPLRTWLTVGLQQSTYSPRLRSIRTMGTMSASTPPTGAVGPYGQAFVSATKILNTTPMQNRSIIPIW